MRRPERVLVTGASRGIGRAIAERLLADGRSVVALARDRARLEALRSERWAPLAVDLVQDPDAVDRACEPFGGLDAVVHAAGVAQHGPLESIDDAQLELAHALHVRASLRLTQGLAAHLRAEGREGSVVHVGSTLATHPAPGTLVYAASKAALAAITRVAALELAPDGIRVNAVAPGVVDTDMVRAPRLAPGEAPPRGDALEARVAAQLDALRELHPLGRLGTPADVADAVVYLLDAPWVTGTILTVDGGLTLR